MPALGVIKLSFGEPLGMRNSHWTTESKLAQENKQHKWNHLLEHISGIPKWYKEMEASEDVTWDSPCHPHGKYEHRKNFLF